MNRSPGGMLTVIAAIALFALVVFQTWSSLRVAGAWRSAKPAVTTAPDDPFVFLDQQLARSLRPLPSAVRDPFRYGGPSTPVASTTTPSRPKVVIPVAPQRPVLTAIVWDNDPRAIINWKGRAWTVHEGLLFDEFIVISIRPEQVVLKRGDESIVLTRKSSGE